MSSLDLVPTSTALIMIDLQNGITGFPLAPYSGPEIVERASRLASAFRERGATIVFVRVALTEMQRLPIDAPPLLDPNAPPPPASASELVAQIDRHPTDLVITKRQWGAFYGTELDQQLRRRGIRTLVLGGIATNFGVESTGRAAFDRGYHLVFVEDAMTSLTQEAHQFATNVIFPRMGHVRTSEAVLDAIRA